jgi:membrane protease YdiL (CAAX protease family)
VKRDWLALVFAMTYPAVMAWLYFVVLAGPPRDPASPEPPRANPAFQAGFAAGKAVQFAFPLLFVWLVEGRRPRPGAPTFRGAGLGLTFGLLVAAAILLVYHGFLHGYLAGLGAASRVRAKVEDFGLDSPGGFLVMAVFISAVHSLLEEYYWRWFVFGRLRHMIPVGAAAVVSGLAFMAHHVIVLAVYFPGHSQFFTTVLPFSLAVAGGGVVWAWLYHQTGSIYAPWLSHTVIDLAIMAVGYDMLFG